MTNLSALFPAGAGKQVSFVADGSISAAGKPVRLTAAGKAAEIVGASDSAGTPVVFEAAASSYCGATFDSNENKVVISYRDELNSDYGTAVVGTVSGTAISYGTPVVFESAAVNSTSATFDSDSNKVVIGYGDQGNSEYGTAIVGTVSGTAISFGTAVVYESATSYYNIATFDSNSNKVVISYRDAGNSSYGTGIVGTVSGTSISFGTAVVFASGTTYDVEATFDSNSNTVVIVYQNASGSDYGTSVVGTVSGTAISYGTPVVFEAAVTEFSSVTFDSNSNKVVIAYRDDGNSMYGTAIVGTVSGTAISFGTAVVFEAARSDYISTAFDSNTNKAVIAYQDPNNSDYGTGITGTVSGTSISFDPALVFETSNTSDTAATFDSDSNKVVIVYRDAGNSNYGTGVVYSTGSTNLTASNLLGISDAAISDTASGNITVKGGIAVNGLSSLTPGTDYYAQGDGTISTVTTSPAVKLGRALSATSIDLEYQS